MTTSVTIRTIFNCSLERAFKTPILCDITKVHTGFGIIPKVAYCTDDENWGKPGYGKNVFAAKTFFQKEGLMSTDTVIERIENKYWKIEVANFKRWYWGFTKFVGEWTTTAIEPNKIAIVYTYTLHATIPLLYPLHWVFTKTLWRIYMKRVANKIRTLAYNNEPYQHE